MLSLEEMVVGEKNVQLCKDTVRGRYYTSKKDFKKGEVVLTEKAYASAIEFTMKKVTCDTCFTQLDTANEKTCFDVKCDICNQLYFCSEKCKQEVKGYHMYECSLLGKFSEWETSKKPKKPKKTKNPKKLANSFFDADMLCALKMIVRLYALCRWENLTTTKQTDNNERDNSNRNNKGSVNNYHSNNNNNYSDYNMKDNNDNSSNNNNNNNNDNNNDNNNTSNNSTETNPHKLYYHHFLELIANVEHCPQNTKQKYLRGIDALIALDSDCTLFSIQERFHILSMWCRYECNSFGLYDGGEFTIEGGKSLGAAFFLKSCFFNHSCDPNVYAKIENGKIHFILQEDVKEGEELTLSYVALTGTTEERQKECKKYFFECGCVRCLPYLEAKKEKATKKNHQSILQVGPVTRATKKRKQ